MGLLIFVALSGAMLYAVLVSVMIKRGRAGRLQSCENLLMSGGFGLAAVGGILFGLVVLKPFGLPSIRSQEEAFVAVAIGLLGGGAYLVVGVLTALAGAALKLDSKGKR